METLKPEHQYLVTVRAFGKISARRYRAHSHAEAIRKARRDAGVQIEAKLVERCQEDE